MADATYQPKVYSKQGAAEFVVASSGAVTVESGGQIDVESGGRIDVESGGYIDVADGGYIKLPLETDSTATIMDGAGVSVVATVGGKRIYRLAAPAAGKEKFIYATVESATDYATISSTAAGATFNISGSTSVQLRFVSNGCVHLLGRSATRWVVVAKTTGLSGQASH